MNTGTPGEYHCVFELRAQDCGSAERAVFSLLAKQRRGKFGQEFFEVDLRTAEAAIHSVCADTNTTNTWAPQHPTVNHIEVQREWPPHPVQSTSSTREWQMPQRSPAEQWSIDRGIRAQPAPSARELGIPQKSPAEQRSINLRPGAPSPSVIPIPQPPANPQRRVTPVSPGTRIPEPRRISAQSESVWDFWVILQVVCTILFFVWILNR